ncbi:hypothetical protein A2U01_0116809, partial [Trifolium medium]|nr:hypothetical protein [Trifolium medium]
PCANGRTQNPGPEASMAPCANTPARRAKSRSKNYNLVSSNFKANLNTKVE